MRGKIRLDKRKSNLSKQGYPICIFLTQDSKSKLISTGLYSLADHWDDVNALPNRKHPNHLTVLNYLEILKPRLQKLIAMSYQDSFTFKQAQYYLTKKSTDVFYDNAIEYVESNNMHQSYRAALIQFQKYYPNCTYDLVTSKLAKEFSVKLLNSKTKRGQRSPNGVRSYIVHLKAIWTRTTDKPNPFKGVRIKAVDTDNKAMSERDIQNILNHDLKKHGISDYGGMYNYVNYWKLCFYLGGIDLADLVKLTKHNIINGRVEFYRSKTKTSFISNKIFPEAYEIFKEYEGSHKEYLVPVTPKNLQELHKSIYRRQDSLQAKLDLSKRLYSKSPRYTFINRALNLLIDERITAEIVGHKERTTHSIYKGRLPDAMKDEAHRKIISI